MCNIITFLNIFITLFDHTNTRLLHKLEMNIIIMIISPRFFKEHLNDLLIMDDIIAFFQANANILHGSVTCGLLYWNGSIVWFLYMCTDFPLALHGYADCINDRLFVHSSLRCLCMSLFYPSAKEKNKEQCFARRPQ